MTKNGGKTGNTIWAGCPSCDAWFPVAPDLLAARVDLHCPVCHLEFTSGDAGRIVRPEETTETR